MRGTILSAFLVQELGFTSLTTDLRPTDPTCDSHRDTVTGPRLGGLPGIGRSIKGDAAISEPKPSTASEDRIAQLTICNAAPEQAEKKIGERFLVF
jgi:hypothetical protein